MSNDQSMFNAAASNAVTSGINSKDAICISRTGRTNKSDNHADAVRELRQSGREGSEIAPKLKRLLDVKSKAQYGARNVTPAEASSAVGWAEDLYRTARGVVAADGR